MILKEGNVAARRQVIRECLPQRSPAPARKKRRLGDVVLLAGFCVSLLFGSFLTGAFLAEFDLPPYTWLLERPFEGLRAQWDKTHVDWSKITWGREPEGRSGLTVFREDRAYRGLTAYSSPAEPATALLVSMTGEVVHRWHLPFSEAFPDPDHVEDPVPDERVHWRRIRLFPNGDLLVIYAALGDTPWGYGLARIDRDSKLIWKYAAHVHHDVDVGEDGRIYTLIHELRHHPVEGCEHLSVPLVEDFVAVLSPGGEEIKRVSIYEAFARSNYREVLISTKDSDKGDHLHTNAVEFIPESFASQHSFCSPGQVLVSTRNNHTLAVLDLESERVVWAMQGVWRRQHDPDLLENGNLLVFDNLGRRGHVGTSRILEVDPGSTRIDWVFEGGPERPLESSIMASQQVLPNGNLLVTESTRGCMLEVSREGEIVWEYYNTIRCPGRPELIANFCSAERFSADDLHFLGEKALARAGRGESKTR